MDPLVAALRQALARRELLLEYQPLVDVRTGAVAGVEALVRWRHPLEGVLLPERFIPQSEANGLIVDDRVVFFTSARVVAYSLSALSSDQLLDDTPFLSGGRTDIAGRNYGLVLHDGGHAAPPPPAPPHERDPRRHHAGPPHRRRAPPSPRT